MAIFISIKPEHIERIISGIKNHEFRKYIPKKSFDKIYVYVSYPVCSLKYILTIDKIIEYPNKIDEEGYGNIDFNNGLKQSKYAYHISKIEEFKPIDLRALKTKFNFNPPQAYAYDTKYPDLVECIKKLTKRRII